MSIENEVTGLSSQVPTPTMVKKKRCVLYMQEHVVGEGLLFGFCLYCDSKIFSAANLAHHVCSPFSGVGEHCRALCEFAICY